MLGKPKQSWIPSFLKRKITNIPLLNRMGKGSIETEFRAFTITGLKEIIDSISDLGESRKSITANSIDYNNEQFSNVKLKEHQLGMFIRFSNKHNIEGKYLEKKFNLVHV